MQEALWSAVGHTEKLFRATFICYQCDTKVAAFIKAEKQLESLRAGLWQIFSKSGFVQAASQIMWFASSSTAINLSLLVHCQWFHIVTPQA